MTDHSYINFKNHQSFAILLKYKMLENYYTYTPKMGLLFLTLLKFIVITVIFYKKYYFKNDML